jgi:WD40 repeat protein
VASCGGDKTVRLWDVAEGKELKVYEGAGAPLYSVAFSPDGTKLAAGGVDKKVFVWEVESGSLLQTISGHSDDLYRVVFSPSGERVLTCGYAGNIAIWNVADGNRVFHAQVPTVAYYAAYTPDGSRVLVGAADAKAYFVDVPGE